MHSRSGGTRSAIPAEVQRRSASSRTRELAATPPTTTSVPIPWSRQALTALRVSTSAIASWSAAAASGTFGSVPAARCASTQRAAAVFRPEKEKA